MNASEDKPRGHGGDVHVERLLELLARLGLPSAPEAQAHAEALLREHVLRRAASAFERCGARALLVKGAALERTAYPLRGLRTMADIDLWAAPRDFEAASRALEVGGFIRLHHDARPLTKSGLVERQFVCTAGAMRLLVELHPTLEKVFADRLDFDEIAARSLPLDGLEPIRAPELIDHILLVALHASGHEYRHPVAYADLSVLLRAAQGQYGAPARDRELVRRARAASLATPLYVALTTLALLDPESVRPELLAALRPAVLRRAALDRMYDLSAFPPARREFRYGLPWMVRQAVLRDDLVRYGTTFARYAGLRGLERTIGQLSRAPFAHDRAAGAVQRAQDAAPSPTSMSGADTRTQSPPERSSPRRAPEAYELPLWVRAFLAVDAIATRLENGHAALRDELFLALIPASERVRVTAALYAKQRTYLPGGHRYEQGLFPWEERAIAHARFPKRGHVLVGAAGAGREARGLAALGYRVSAFDPCEAFVDAASSALEHQGEIRFARGAYEDLEPASRGVGPLAELLSQRDPRASEREVHAVVLGWGSLSHVAPHSARAKLLRDVRAVAPRAVVLTSFALHPDSPPVRVRALEAVGAAGDDQLAERRASKGRARDALRRIFSTLGAPGESGAGDHFYPDAGFLTMLWPDELYRIAFRAGYEVVLFEEGPYPHALLAPVTG